MTEIKSAINHIDNLIGMIEDNQGTDYDADFRLAINSLKALEEVRTVLTELEKYKEEFCSYAFKFNDEYYDGKTSGLEMAIKIINQKLEQIKEVR